MLVVSLHAEHSERSESGGGTMKIIWSGLIILATTAGLSTAQSGVSDVTKGSSGSLGCKISVQKLHWLQPESAKVAVVIENRSEAGVSVPVAPSFTLKPPAQPDELSYVALWDLRKGTTLPVSTTVPLELKAGQSKTIESDVSELLWSRINWSVLPHSKLYAVVPAGKYSLRLDLGGNDGRLLCSSNAVDVLIK